MIYVFLAEGFEESEALVTVDVLRRAKYDVRTVGVSGEFVTGSHGITVKTDVLADDIVPEERLEAVILPGGMPGTTNLENSERVAEFVSFAADNSLVIGAICAAPSILGKRGLLKNRMATCYPGFEQYLEGAFVETAPVCISDNYVTANGAGSVFGFALAVVDMIAWYNGKLPFGDFSLSQQLEESMQCAR